MGPFPPHRAPKPMWPRPLPAAPPLPAGGARTLDSADHSREISRPPVAGAGGGRRSLARSGPLRQEQRQAGAPPPPPAAGPAGSRHVTRVSPGAVGCVCGGAHDRMLPPRGRPPSASPPRLHPTAGGGCAAWRRPRVGAKPRRDRALLALPEHGSARGLLGFLLGGALQTNRTQKIKPTQILPKPLFFAQRRGRCGLEDTHGHTSPLPAHVRGAASPSAACGDASGQVAEPPVGSPRVSPLLCSSRVLHDAWWGRLPW